MLTHHGRQHKLTFMEPVLEIAEGAASNDPDTGLRAVAALRALAERLEILQVQNARERGWSWQEIAERLGAGIGGTFGPQARAGADLGIQQGLRHGGGSREARGFRRDPRGALPPRLRRSGRGFRAERAVTATPPRPSRPAEAAGRCRADGAPQDGHIPFTPVAKHILELTLRETRTLQDPNIGVQHLALALTAVRRGTVPSLLAAADAPAPALRAEILDRYRQAS